MKVYNNPVKLAKGQHYPMRFTERKVTERIGEQTLLGLGVTLSVAEIG